MKKFAASSRRLSIKAYNVLLQNKTRLIMISERLIKRRRWKALSSSRFSTSPSTTASTSRRQFWQVCRISVLREMVSRCACLNPGFLLAATDVKTALYQRGRCIEPPAIYEQPAPKRVEAWLGNTFSHASTLFGALFLFQAVQYINLNNKLSK